MKQRVLWLDVVKCFGICAVFWAHYGLVTAKAPWFVCQYNAELFFLVSGCSEHLGRESGIRSSVQKSLRGILVPWLFFCVLSMVIHVLNSDCELLSLWPMIWKILQGTIRNTFVASGLWFLTCVAMLKVLFAFVRKLKKMWLILAVCLVCHVATWFFLDVQAPVLPFNLDCALYYLLYYGLGYAAFPWIQRLLNSEKRSAALFRGVSLCATAMFCAYLYFGRNFYGFLQGYGLIGQNLMVVLTALTAIWPQILLAHIFQDVECFQKIGRNTLYLCGSEYLVRVFMVAIAAALGIQLTITTSLVSGFSVLLSVWWANKYLVPIEQRIVAELLKVLDFFRKKSAAASNK